MFAQSMIGGWRVQLDLSFDGRKTVNYRWCGGMVSSVLAVLHLRNFCLFIMRKTWTCLYFKENKVVEK